MCSDLVTLQKWMYLKTWAELQTYVRSNKRDEVVLDKGDKGVVKIPSFWWTPSMDSHIKQESYAGTILRTMFDYSC